MPTLARTFGTSGGLTEAILFSLDLGELREKNDRSEQAAIKNGPSS